mmetsp:Transcript_34150/g.83985  ORF Transcript_34150/g.83985 Transcript_34150/m.83985 type:complete len:447 (-) Transcript_34150:39-1379(-)
MFFNGTRAWAQEESVVQRQAQDDHRFQERDLLNAFEPRPTSRFTGPLDKECPSMTMLHALSIATDRATTTKPPRTKNLRGPRAWIRHAHTSRSTTPNASAPHLFDSEQERAPDFRTAGRGTWRQSSERVVLALTSSNDAQPHDAGGGIGGMDLRVHGHLQATELSTGSHSGRRLLMMKANSSSSHPGTPSPATRPPSRAPSTANGKSRPRDADVSPQSSSFRSGGGADWRAMDAGMMHDPDWRSRHDHESQHWDPPRTSHGRSDVRLGTPIVQLTMSPEELRRPIRGGPNCTIEPLFLDGRSSFSPEFRISRQLSGPFGGKDERGRAMEPGSNQEKMKDNSVPPALRHGRADPVRTVRLRSVPLSLQSRLGSQNMSRPQDSRQLSTSIQDQDFEMEPWRADSSGRTYDPQIGELNPLAPARIPSDDLERQRDVLLRSAGAAQAPHP